MIMQSTPWRQPERLELRRLLSIATETMNLETYVAAIYHDVLGRAIDPGAKAFVATELQQGDSVFDISAQIADSNEHFADLIQSDYAKFLGRGAEAAGVDAWLSLGAMDRPDEYLEAKILASDEFYARVGATNEGYVDALYGALLGRPADAAGEATWLEQLESGASRFQISLAFAESPERERLRVVDDYLQVFHRQGDDPGIAFWTSQLAAGKSNEDVLAGLVDSPEYFASRTGQPITTVPIPSSSFSWWQSYEDQIDARARQGNVDLLFVGDSQVTGWNLAGDGQSVWDQFYASGNAMAAGLPGDTTQGVLWTLIHSDLSNLQPKLTVVEVGTNNLSEGDSPADIAAGTTAIVQTLHEEFPETRILLMGILPRGESANSPLRTAVAATNALVQVIADGQNVFYVDLSPLLLGADGAFLPGLVQPDFVHLTSAGYEIWAQAIEPIVKGVIR